MEKELWAGPVRCKFADGELRYLKIGDTELVRRVFFAVRTKTWDTLTPKLTNVSITNTKNTFTITLEARCDRRDEGYDSDGAYAWSGTITGKADGTITFAVTGAPLRDFSSNRIGLCVLFGTPDVCGKPYDLVGKDGGRVGKFPTAVNAPLTFEEDFTELRYEQAVVQLTGAGRFSMEDQRNFGDSSFKAYATLPYAYPNVKEGDGFTQTVTITPLKKRPVASTESKTTLLTVGPRVPSRVLTRIRTSSTGERNWFHGINHDREKAKAAPTISFAYFPTEHNFDDDTCWDNVPVIVELAESVRKFAPGKPIDIHHIALTLTHPRPTPEPRNANPMGAAWTAACLKYASLAGVQSATFDMGPGYANRVLKALKPLIGQPIRQVVVSSSALVAPVDAFGIGESLVVINKTGLRQLARLENLAEGQWLATELNGQTPAGLLPRPTPVRTPGNSTSLNLAPHEVRILTRR